MSWLWGRIHPRSDSREKGRESLGYMKGGLKTLTDVLKQKILDKGGRFHFKSNIDSISAHAQGVRLMVNGEARDYDRCVVTVDNEAALKMVQDMPEARRRALQDIQYMGAVMLILKMSRPLSQTYWLNNASPDFPFSGVIEHTNLVPPAYYNGRRVAYVFKYLSPDDPLLSLDREATLALFLEKGRKIFPGLTQGQIVESMHYKTTKATPVYSGRYSTRIPGFELLDGRVYLLNTAQIYPQDRNLSNGIELSLRLLKQWSAEKMAN